jgi:hypothetical protein
MNCEGDRVQVSLVVKAGVLNELLVFRIVGNGCQGLAVCPPHPAVIDVKKSVRSRQQPRWLRRRMLPQLNGKHYRSDDKQNPKNERESASYSHEMRLGLK